MGEIKSTLELAMERAEKIEVSPKEIEKLKREEYVTKAKGMVNRYLDGNLNISALKKELNNYDEGIKGIITEALIFEFVNGISISSDNKRLLEAIETLTQGKVKPVNDKINKLCNAFYEEKGNQFEKLETKIRKSLYKTGISGTAIQPKVDSDEDWYRSITKLASEYESKLMKLKSKLLDLGDN